MSDITKKVVLIGDVGSGKTTLCRCFGARSTASSQDFEPQAITVRADDQTTIQLTVWDTPGSDDDYENLRKSCYKNFDGLIVCFSLADPSSLQRISSRLGPLVKKHCPNVPLVLVGTKKDLRDASILSTVDIKSVADKLRAFGLVECSSTSGEGVQDVLIVTAKACLAPRKAQGPYNCVLL